MVKETKTLNIFKEGGKIIVKGRQGEPGKDSFVPGPKGEPGKDGLDYKLTEKDKKEIAKSILVPIVEKVIEKREIVREQPIIYKNITNEIKEVAVADSAETIVDKINELSLDDENKIDASHIKNLPEPKGNTYGGGLSRGVADSLYAPIGSTGSAETFETVSKNLKSSNGVSSVFNGDGTLQSITYENGITKTFTYNPTTLVITLSGTTPSGINLIKTVDLTTLLPTYS